MQKFIHLAANFNIAAGILLLTYWYLYAILLPYQQIDASISILVMDRHWLFVNILGIAGSLCGLIGLFGIFIQNVEKISTLGMIGFVLAMLGTSLITVTIVWDTVIWPILVNVDTTILDFNGPIYTNKTFLPYFAIAGLIYSLGYGIFGIVMAKSGVDPYWGSIFLAIGAPLFVLGSLFGKIQIYPRSIGISLLCAGLIWFGMSMRPQ